MLKKDATCEDLKQTFPKWREPTIIKCDNQKKTSKSTFCWVGNIAIRYNKQ